MCCQNGLQLLGIKILGNFYFRKMSSPTWKTDVSFKEDLEKYVAQNLHRTEISNIIEKDYPFYPSSVATLGRMLRHFGISYINRDTSAASVIDAVKQELNGTGKCLGYRAMNQKLRTKHNIKVPRHNVADIVQLLDPDGVEERTVKHKKKRAKVPFVSNGPDWVWSLDGHDKMEGYQNWTFPLAIYGCQDTFSRKILFLEAWDTNSDPQIIASFYMKHLSQTKKIPRYMRVDLGTENGLIGTIQSFLRRHHADIADATDTFLVGPSTSNKIERFWRDLHERMEKAIKEILLRLLNNIQYDPHNELDRKLCLYVFLPVLQKELDDFKEMWNCHRVRAQHGLQLPCGVPNHMYRCPEEYGGEEMGMAVTEDELVEVGVLANIESAPNHYLTPEDIALFSTYLQNPELLDVEDLEVAYLGLRKAVKTGGLS